MANILDLNIIVTTYFSISPLQQTLKYRDNIDLYDKIAHDLGVMPKNNDRNFKDQEKY